MKISIIGLGYVGCVSAACFAKEGHEVIGVDVNEKKVEMINQGKSPIVEDGLEALIAKTRYQGKLKATLDVKEGIINSDVTFICVGTPSKSNGDLNYDIIKKACRSIGDSLKSKQGQHIIVIRSTILPGFIRGIAIPVLEEASGMREGSDFYVCTNPEFLREGTSLKDFYDPPFILVGLQSAKKGSSELKELYHNINAEYIETSIEVSEMIKYGCNAFHALKIVFANEIGILCKSLNVDSHEVMKIFCRDKKLNISEKYLSPGFSFGGSCLPKDLRAMSYRAKASDVDILLLNSILPSNRMHFDKTIELILSLERKRVGILGMSFKEGTDDLRESPLVAMAEVLLGKGIDVKIYDKNVFLARLFGANREFIEKQIPHISRLMKESVEEVISSCDIIVAGSRDIDKSILLRRMDEKQILIDLVRLFDLSNNLRSKYYGICW